VPSGQPQPTLQAMKSSLRASVVASASVAAATSLRLAMMVTPSRWPR